ncbi:ABC transporter permease [Streptomyces albiaxialis]
MAHPDGGGGLMFVLAWRTLRFRRGGFVATFLALFFGTVLVMACGGLLETGVRNNAPPQRLAGADLVVTGDRSYELTGRSADDSESAVLTERVPVRDGLVREVRSTTGVRSAVPEPVFDAAVLGGRGTDGGRTDVEGHGWSSAALTPYRTSAGRAPAADDQVVLDARTARAAGAEPGDRIRLAVPGGTRTYEVSGIAAPRGGRQAGKAVVFFTDARARALAGGEIADIAVVAAPGQDVGALKSRLAERVAESGARAKVVSGDDRGAVEYPDVERDRESLIVIASVFGGLAAMVAVFVVVSTVSLSVRQRHREFALMRATGATPRQLRRMLLAETLLVALLAAAGGALAGPYAGEQLFTRLVDAGLVEGAVVHSQGWIPAVAAGGALLLTALVGGTVGARRAVRTHPGRALTEAATGERWLHPVRLVLAVLFLGGATALATLTVLLFDGPIAASTAGPTVICAAAGLALLGPGLTKLVTFLVSPLVRLLTGRGPSGELALLNSRARTVRMASVVTPVLLATGMAVGNLYLQTTQVRAAEDAFRENLRADAVLTAPVGGVDPALTDRVRKLDGVAAASAYVTTTGHVERPHDGADDGDGLPLQGVTGRDATRTTAVRPTEGSLSALTGRTVALPESRADELGKGVGDTLRLRLGDGAATDVHIVALFEGRAGYETALAPASLLAPHTTTGLPRQIMVRAEPGTDGAELMAALHRFTEGHPGLQAADRDALLAANAEDVQLQAWINYLLVGMIVAYTAIAVVNSQVLSVTNRKREFGLMRLGGATRAQVLRTVSVEALLVTAVGLLLGTLAAATSLIPFAVAAADTWLPSGPLSIYAAVAGTATALTLGAALAATWSVTRGREADAAVAAE